MPQDQDDIKGADAMKQAPTPGPLDWTAHDGAEVPIFNTYVDVVKRDGSEWTNVHSGQWGQDWLWSNDDTTKADIVSWRPSLAPTAPVEASGSEREDTFKGDDDALVASITALLDLPDSALSHRVPGLAKQLLASAASRLSLRPQPSGETREEVAQALERIGAAHFKANGENIGHATVLAIESEILALIRPAPVASGGQHSGGEVEKWIKRALIYIEQCVQAAEIHFPGVEEDPADLAVQGFALFGLEGECDPAAIPNAKLLSTTPARTEAQDEGAAGEVPDGMMTLADELEDKADELDEMDARGQVWGLEDVSDLMRRARNALRAHPSPTPAADADRVRDV